MYGCAALASQHVVTRVVVLSSDPRHCISVQRNQHHSFPFIASTSLKEDCKFPPVHFSPNYQTVHPYRIDYPSSCSSSLGGMLDNSSFAGVLAACPPQSRDGLIPIRADEFFVYPDPGFWENLAESCLK